MASSKSKKPPALRQRTPVAAEEEKQTIVEPESAERTAVNRIHDQSLFTAFKKLKVDSEGNCVQRTEDQSQIHLRHKPDVQDLPASDPDRGPVGTKDWSVSLEKFCFCDEGALHKKGRSRLKHMCSYHRQRSLKRDGGGGKNAGLVQAWRTHKPLLQESRFGRVDKPGQLLQAARLTLKPSCKKELGSGTTCPDKHAGAGPPSPDAPKKPSAPLDTKSDNSSNHITREGSSPPATGDKPSPLAKKEGPPPCHTTEDKLSPKATGKNPPPSITEDKLPLGDSPRSDSGESPTKTPSTSSQPVFAAQASRHLPSFSSLQRESGKAAASPSSATKQPSVPHFQEHRGVGRGHHMPRQSPGGACRPALFSLDSQRAGATAPPPPRVELSVERSCSQEARLDESEFSANELAAYLDNFLHLPKEMSSMAQMMYT